MTIETVSKQMTAGKTATNKQSRSGAIRAAFSFAGRYTPLLGLVPIGSAPATYLESTMGLLDQAHSFAQGASNGVAGSLTGPVDGLAWLLRKAGVPVPQAPLGGSDWMRNVGLLQEPKERMAGLLGEGLGSALPTVIAGKAPEIAGGLLKMGDNLNAPRTLNPQTGAIVWHGSPHKFEKFDSSKIGTGEGAQAYGHGLYLAENKSVADEYAGKLSKPIVDFSKKSPQDKYEMAIAKKLQSLAETTQSGSKYDALAKQFDSYLNPRLEKWNPKHPNANAYNGMAPLEGDDLANAIAYRDAAKRLGEFDLGDAGSLYKVDLPDEHIAKMLDWDKPLSQQSKEVQKMLEPLGYSTRAQVANFDDELLAALSGSGSGPATKINNPLGSEIARGGGIFDSLGQIAKSEKLKELGIPGIRYLDGGSRASGAGTSNYVVFPGNEGLLKILERNGQGLLGN